MLHPLIWGAAKATFPQQPVDHAIQNFYTSQKVDARRPAGAWAGRNTRRFFRMLNDPKEAAGRKLVFINAWGIVFAVGWRALGRVQKSGSFHSNFLLSRRMAASIYQHQLGSPVPNEDSNDHAG